MHALHTAVMRHSDEFTRNRAHYEQLVADLRKHLAWSQAGGPADAVEFGPARRGHRSRVFAQPPRHE